MFIGSSPMENANFQVLFEQIEFTNQHFFITGQAGTGKSTFLNFLKKNSQKNLVVLAPTGLAAINIGGQTIHSFFKFKFGIHSQVIKKVSNNKIYKSLQLLIIDEVSMLRADLLDNIDKFLRLNGPNKHLPFGGVQVVFIGDLFQLPPVLTKADAEWFYKVYDTPYFLSAKVFQVILANLQLVELQEIFRQTDPLFIYLLKKIRHKKITEREIEILNQRYYPDFQTQSEDPYLTLTTTNAQADSINKDHLDNLEGPSLEFKAEIKGQFNSNSYPVEQVLKLKVGTQVVFVRNDVQKRWVNGTIGRIVNLKKNWISCKTKDKYFRITKEEWQNLSYSLNAENEIESEIIGVFRQYPIKLAWAVTIHKSQGQTFDKVIIDLAGGTFAHGQLYVALSRCQSLEGIILKQKIRLKDIILDKKILDFYQFIRQKSLF